MTHILLLVAVLWMAAAIVLAVALGHMFTKFRTPRLRGGRS